MPESKKEKLLYLCDPNRNNICSKSYCFVNGGECTMTKNPNFAKIGTMPIKLSDIENIIKEV